MVAVFCALLLFLNPLPWLNFSNLPALPQPIAQLARASVTTPQHALERLFTSEQLRADWFLPSFLEQVPPDQVQGVVSQLTRNFGEFQGVEETPDGFDVQFAEGTVVAQIRITPEGQIAGLFFQPPAVPISLDRAIALMQNFPYTSSLLVTKTAPTPASPGLNLSSSDASGIELSDLTSSSDSNTPNLEAADLEVPTQDVPDQYSSVDLAAVNAEDPLAVGSTFKLAVLAALKNQSEEGRQQWDTVVQLQPEWKSLPSGMLQDWPSGTNLTLDTLATLMISVSDNTATDALITIVGRENVEALSPRNQPFLTTKEAFALKNPDNARLLRRYTSGNEAGKRRVLQDLENSPLPGKSLFSAAPIAPEVEWFFTTRELCNLMTSVAELDAMQVNPGVANPREWEQIAFKGGSEPGVLSLTTGLYDAEGNAYCVSATWNSSDEPLDEGMLTQFYESVIAGLRGRGSEGVRE
jgi:beta-lactamase class A